VNGAINPVGKVPRGLVRLRILDAANARNFYLRFSDERTFHVIASDGGYLATPAPVTELRVSPGERFEVLVDFSNSARQTTFDNRLDQIGCEEGERDRHVDFADTALLARGDLFDICCSASGDFIEPAPTAVNSGDPLKRVADLAVTDCTINII
jgi:FtsP/CotA-like multicopper oxidase with cupredoxin domain